MKEKITEIVDEIIALAAIISIVGAVWQIGAVIWRMWA